MSRTELIALIGQKDALIEQKDATIQQKDASIQQKERQIAKLQRMLFGQKRERFEQSPIQLPLDFGEQLSEQEIKELAELINTKALAHKGDQAKEPRQPHPGRSPLPKHLPVEEIIIEPAEDTTGMVLMGQEVSDSLQYVPSRFYIQRIIRPKYIKAAQSIDQASGFAIAALPQSGFGKCMAGASLIAQILIDKFWDHLPLYRQQQRFKREGIDIAASTIDHWVKLGMQRLELLYEYQKGLVLHSPYLQVDETVIKVLDHQNKSGNRGAGRAHQGYFWAYHDPVGKQTFFKYEPTRAGAYPSAMLKDFTGYLQTDGYGGYGAISQKENIVHLACWAHTRRYVKKNNMQS
ncbi:IS66 family transposase [Dyadobacter pollutisoli]|uniref:IS66 family transposase n=1 Tax=Dyadobacter pollutisoli TaxID=2910158 RepID=A0A9E8NF91_9BACT|nr:IS66 family transposase [Dyadobacter pollutisoli]WAC13212.1 IS66 family transposase [Dyadobacter pollutisoli]